MPKHRVPLLGTGLRRFEDPERSSDPQISAVVTALKQLPADAIAPEPRAHFRAELRAQLVAVAPRIIAEEATHPATKTAATRTAAPASAPAEARTQRVREPRGFGRPLRLAGAVLTLFLVVLGGAVWTSQRAVPGDTLYGLKRATESVRLAFAGSDTARAKLYLGFAGTRVDEAKTLVARSVTESSALSAAGRLSPSTASLVRGTLGSSDSDIRAASRLLTTDAVQTRSGAGLAALRRWAPSQLSRLRQLAAMLPPGALRHRTAASSHLVQQAAQRARAVDASLNTSCVGGSGSDSLGVLPCGTSSAHHRLTRHHAHPGTRHSGHSGVPQPGATSGSGGNGGTRSGGTGSGGSTPPQPGASSSSPGGAVSSLPSLPLPTPTLPIPTLPSLSTSVSLPVSVNSCNVTLPLGISLGNCPSK